MAAIRLNRPPLVHCLLQTVRAAATVPRPETKRRPTDRNCYCKLNFVEFSSVRETCWNCVFLISQFSPFLSKTRGILVNFVGTLKSNFHGMNSREEKEKKKNSQNRDTFVAGVSKDDTLATVGRHYTGNLIKN